ncbi:O-antigen ligase family protein [Metabacillus arenae]|uniref:O-antigen ligase family protein n=1 Tax=Metabacillus arenae TaxID=2771434 RepID=A0A926NG90_9BACI|nr:O-antigen ligase family protein [Metabacillus arenae]MBD1380726.1 O-antigen ligase family protein [Metabacillus arenae]
MINLQLILNQDFIKKYSLEIGIILCFVLPPIGILWLMFIGWNHLNKAIDLKVPFYFNTTTFFYICLAIAALGASFSEKNGKFILIFAMILGYLGLYLYIKERATFVLFHRFKHIMIAGAVYLIGLGMIVREFPVTNVLFGLLTGTKLFAPSTEAGGRIFGSAYNPNFTCFLLLVTFTFILADLLKRLQDKSIKISKWVYIITLFIVIGIFQTGSRAGVATMLVILFIFVLRAAPKIGLAILAISFLAKDQILEIIPRSKFILESAFVRKEIWETSFQIWKDHPYFGTTSIGFYEAYSHLGSPVVPHAHNILLAFFAEYGTIGGLAFILLSITITFKFCSLFFLNGKKKRLLDFFILSLPVILLTGIFDHPLVSPQTALLTTILVACWDRYTGSLPFVHNSALYLKRFIVKMSYFLEGNTEGQHLTKTDKEKSKYKI